ncbi:hypothetical protein OF83DRAFT_1177085 [Amylostereum chailletii]|nr:hypothetical protein OF83DRAFT_1177085 [Amylostereum chailletii]
MGDKSNGKNKEIVSTPPRVTYHAEGRTFDRLFKEASLKETRDVVRRKLGLPSATAVELSQLREGKKIDLEDDDDFDAFRALARSRSHAEVLVTIKDAASVSESPTRDGQAESSRKRGRSPSPPPAPPAAKPVSSKGKKKAQLPETSVTPETPVPEKKKRKVMFDASADAGSLRTSEKGGKPSEVEKPKQKKDKAAQSSSIQPVASDADLAGASSSTGVVVNPKKKRKKKEPKDVPPVAGPSRLPDVPSPKVAFPQTSQSSDALPVTPAKVDKKRKRTASETIVTESDAVEARPKKKKKKGKKAETAPTLTEGMADQSPTSAPESSLPPNIPNPIPDQTFPAAPSRNPSLPAKSSLSSSSPTVSSPRPPLETDASKSKDRKRKKGQDPSDPPQPAESRDNGPTLDVSQSNAPTAKVAKKGKASKDKSPAEAASKDAGGANASEPPPTKTKKKAKAKAATPLDNPTSGGDLDVEPAKVASSSSQTLAHRQPSRKPSSAITDKIIQEALDSLIFGPRSEPASKSSSSDSSPASASAAPTKPGKKAQAVAKKQSGKSKLSMTWLPEDLETTPSATSGKTEPSNNSEQDNTKVGKSAKKGKEASTSRAKKPAAVKTSCPACFESPYHSLEECPIVVDGEESIESCIEELEGDPSLADPNIVDQLKAFLRKVMDKDSSSVDVPPTRPVDRRASQPSSGPLSSKTFTLDSAPSSSASTPVSASKLTIPLGLPISEVHVETQDEGSSNDSSDEESDEEPRKPSGPSSGKRAAQGMAPPPKLNPSTLEDDLAALLRGPERRGPRKSILDEIPLKSDSDTEEESEPEDLALDEDEDLSLQSARRRPRRRTREKSSSEEPEQSPGSADRSLSPPVFMDAQPNFTTNKQTLPELEPAGHNQSDEEEEDTPVDALAERAAKAESEAGTDDSRSPEPDPAPQDTAPQPDDESAHDDGSPSPNAKNASPEPQGPAEEEEASPDPDESHNPVVEDDGGVDEGSKPASPEPESDATAINTDAAKTPSISPPPPAKPVSVEIPPPTQVLVPSSPSPSPPPAAASAPISPEIEPLKLSPPDGKAPTTPEAPADEQVDEIESVPSVQAEREPESDPIEPASQPSYDRTALSLKPGTVKRLRDRNGKSRGTEKDLPVLASSQATEQVSEDEGDTRKDTQTRRSGRLARQSTAEPDAPAAPVPKKRGRKPLTEEEKAARAAAAAAEKEEKARIRVEKAQAAKEKRAAAAAAKKQTKAPMSRARSRASKTPAVASDSDTPEPRRAEAAEPPSSQAQWATLTQSTPALPSESSAVDELRSSPDEARGAAKVALSLPPSSDVEATPKAKNAHAHAHGEPDRSSQGTQPADDPLFFPGSSQFPRTQASQSQSQSQRTPAPNGVGSRRPPSDSEEESPVPTTAKARPQRQSSSQFRRLKDLASQDTLFSPSGLAPSTPFPPPSSQVKKTVATVHEAEEEEEEEESSDSDSDDSDAPPKSHIPKNRRAGAGTKKKKPAGLLSFV